MAEMINKQHPLYQEDLKRILNILEIERLKGKSFLITGPEGPLIALIVLSLTEQRKQSAPFGAVIRNDNTKFCVVL